MNTKVTDAHFIVAKAHQEYETQQMVDQTNWIQGIAQSIVRNGFAERSTFEIHKGVRKARQQIRLLRFIGFRVQLIAIKRCDASMFDSTLFSCEYRVTLPIL